MKWLRWHFCGWLLLAGRPAGAQVPAPMGDGLKGDYYDGHDFNTFVLSQRDAAINFDWHHENPVPGLTAEDFSVRWTGWLVPPATGHYVLRLTVDDGARLWLDGRQLLNEWRGQSLSYYAIPLDLKAGQAYALRLDYCQYGWSTRAVLAWQRPEDVPEASWRNLWGLASDDKQPGAIPTRYLFSRNPTPPARPAPPRPALAARVAKQPELSLARPLKLASTPKRRRAALGKAVPQPIVPTLTSARPVPLADSGQVAAVATRLAAGQAVTLRALYFMQGKADLPLAVRASLDTLAAALATRPTLRLEVQGHTDNQGDSALNRQLSQRRAEAVAQYLAAHGVEASRLRAVGYGGTQPVADNSQLAQRPRNRRVVLLPFAR
jgi:outer membrane protein OmpA-like peptidoglycan-associated protein